MTTVPTDLPVVILPLETTVRELDSKVVVGSALAARGCRAIVAHKEVAREVASRSRRIVWQGKSLFSVQSEDHLADQLAANGSSIVFVTDEGAMYHSHSWVEQTLHKHWSASFRPEHLGRLSVWGSRQASVIAQHSPQVADFLAITGSPRFDLCLPKYEWLAAGDVGSLVQERAPYVLACTRFASVAHAKGMSAPFELKLDPKEWRRGLTAAQIADLWLGRWRQDVHDFAEFVLLIRELARMRPDLPIVVRPHPSEDIRFYSAAYATLSNVEVVRSGNILDWIRGARMVVHSNSTSGVEAVLAGRPTLNFLPQMLNQDRVNIAVADEAGVEATSIRDALDKVDSLLSGTSPPSSWSDRARQMLNNLTTEAVPILTEATMRVLEERGIESSSLVLPKTDGVTDRIRDVLRKSRSRGTPAGDAYLAGKRGSIEARRVEHILDGCRERGIGRGRLREATPRYVVIDPT